METQWKTRGVITQRRLRALLLIMVGIPEGGTVQIKNSSLYTGLEPSLLRLLKIELKLRFQPLDLSLLFDVVVVVEFDWQDVLLFCPSWLRKELAL